MRALSIVFLLLLASLTAAADTAPTYPIKLNRPFHTGDLLDLHETFDRTATTTTTTAGRAPQTTTQHLYGDLTARVQVVHANERGDAADATLTITRLLRADGSDMVAAGSIIDIHRTTTEATLTARRDQPLPNEARNLLGIFFPHLNAGAVTGDAAFGSTVNRAVGASWEIDHAIAAQYLTGTDLTVDARAIQGRTTLKGVEMRGALPFVRVLISVTVDHATHAPLKDWQVDGCTLRTDLSMLAPADPTLTTQELRSTSDTTVRLTSRRSRDTTAESRIHTVHTTLYTALPLAPATAR